MRLIIDTDPGMGTVACDPEDAMAILGALHDPGVTLDGLTLVHGNVPVSHSWRNVRHLLDLAGRPDVDVHRGAAGPRCADRRPAQVAWLHQREGMDSLVPPLDLPPASATEFLCQTVLDAPGEVTLVAIGPLTNVAAAIDAEPGFADALAGLFVMGGTVATVGNITPAAEFNLWMDPDAARVVFDSGVDLTMIGLDVCRRTRLDAAHAQELRASGSPLGAFVAETSDAWRQILAVAAPDEDVHLYDSLAVAAAIDPSLCTYRRALVEVETGTGPAQGMTVTHRNEVLRQLLVGRDHNAAVAVDVDADRFMVGFADRLLGDR